MIAGRAGDKGLQPLGYLTFIVRLDSEHQAIVVAQRLGKHVIAFGFVEAVQQV